MSKVTEYKEHKEPIYIVQMAGYGQDYYPLSQLRDIMQKHIVESAVLVQQQTEVTQPDNQKYLLTPTDLGCKVEKLDSQIKTNW